jgi:Mce-associated membrane protein
VTDEERTGKERPPWLQAIRSQWAAIVLSLVLIAAVAVTSWLFFYQYRPDREVDDAARQSAIKAASDGTVALLSYSPETLDKDFAAAKSKLTGDFLSYYTQFTEQIVAPAAKQKKVKTTASVVRSAVSELRPDSALVLVFINQTTESTGLPEPSVTVSSVRVSLKKVDGAWLISSFDPV